MTSSSIGWKTDVVFEGKKTSWIFAKLKIDECAVQLSKIRAIFLSFTRNFRSNLRTQCTKIWVFLQLFFRATYWQGRYLIFLKQWEFFWFAINKHWKHFSCSTSCRHSSYLLCFSSLRSTIALWGDRFYREGMVEEANIISIKYIFQRIIWQYGWQGCFIPRTGHFICNRLALEKCWAWKRLSSQVELKNFKNFFKNFILNFLSTKQGNFLPG